MSNVVHYRGCSDPANRAPVLSLPQREPYLFGRAFVPLKGRGKGAGKVVKEFACDGHRLSWRQWHASRAKLALHRAHI